MSISTVATKITYVGNDSTVTPYPITFKYLEDSHVNVYVDGVLQVLGAAQDYVLAGDGAAGTGSFTTKVAQDATKSVVVVLDVPFDQPVVLQETSSLPAKVMEVEGFDRLNMQIRRVWRRLQDAITFSNDEGGTGSTGTADNLLGFDGSGDIAEIPNSTFVQTADGIDGNGDVTITNPISGEVLSWNGSAWVNDVSGNGDALVANGLDQFAATTSAELAGVLTDETGSGAVVFATSPTLVTPDLGVPTAIDLTSATNTPLPAAGTVTEAMLNATTNTSLNLADASMQPATYDPNTVAGDAFDSVNHTYTPAGTGAVDTVVETKLRESVSVKDFGATGDGTTDDTTEIQAAIDAVSAAGGGELYFPAGTYIMNGATGLTLKTGVMIKGVGMGATTIKNDTASWKYVFLCTEGDNVGFEDLTIDGNWSTREPVTVDVDTKRGEGILINTGGTPEEINNLRISNVEVKNTGHYGIGLQSVNVVSGIINNVHFENIGGDCIDIKSSGTPSTGSNYNKKLIVDGVFTTDGCGHNNTGYKTTPATAGHNGQAVVDVGGQVVLSNVFISGLDSFGDDVGDNHMQTGNVGVRFRAPVSPSRNGSAGSVANNIYVSSSKLVSEGTEGAIGTGNKQIKGVVVNDQNVTLSNVYVENCLWGVDASNTTDGRPWRLNMHNIMALNCRGASNNGYGLRLDEQAKHCSVDAIVEDCDNGAYIDGDTHRIGLTMIDNDVGLEVKEAVIRQSTWNFTWSNNTTAAVTNSDAEAGGGARTTQDYIDASTSVVGIRDLKVMANREPNIDLVSLANDTGWGSPNEYFGKLNFVSNDDSGHGSGTRVLVGARMTGSTGGSSDLQIAIENGSGLEEVAVFKFDSILFQKPPRLPIYSTANLPADALEGSMAYDSTLNKLSIKTAASGGWETVTSA